MASVITLQPAAQETQNNLSDNLFLNEGLSVTGQDSTVIQLEDNEVTDEEKKRKKNNDCCVCADDYDDDFNICFITDCFSWFCHNLMECVSGCCTGCCECLGECCAACGECDCDCDCDCSD